MKEHTSFLRQMVDYFVAEKTEVRMQQSDGSFQSYPLQTMMKSAEVPQFSLLTTRTSRNL